MTKKTSVWVIVRFDWPAQEHSDYVAVKGVYDSREDAQAAADRAAANHPTHEASYHIIQSRRFISDSQAESEASSERQTVQGMGVDQLRRYPWHMIDLPVNTPLRSLAEQLPRDIRKRVLQPLIAYYAENAIARALGATWPRESETGPDLELADGTRVEVKTVFLDPEKSRAPFVQYRPHVADYLALVLVTPDFEFSTARLIPSEVLSHFERPGPTTREAKLGSLRITSDLMNAPGTSSIDLSRPKKP
jgi:hypothetical protein